VAAALPLVLPSYVVALVLVSISGPGGLLDEALAPLIGEGHVPKVSGFGGALLALTLATYPYVFLLTAAGLRALDPALEEASRSLGRSHGATFRTVTLPLVRPSIVAGALLAMLYTLSDFGVVAVMQYDALTRAIFLQYRSLLDRTPAAVLGLVLIVLAAAILAAEAAAVRRSRLHRSGPGVARTPRRVPLGRLRVPAVAFCAAVVGVALVGPIGVLLVWLRRAVAAGDLGDDLLPAIGGTLLGSGSAALAAAAAALPVGLLALRHPGRFTGVLSRLSYASNSLPGIVIALALVFFTARYAPFVYQTFAVLVFAYVVRFFPQALAATDVALGRLDPRIEEASRSLGRGPRHTFLTVTVPLVTPGILTGVALVFLSAMKELPATLLLRPIGFDTLATSIWDATAVASYSRAAAPALLLVALAAPLVYGLVVRPQRARLADALHE
jgi:iron(III) transport system permease protein